MAKAKVMKPWYFILDSTGNPSEAMNQSVFFSLDDAKDALIDDWGVDNISGFSIVEVRPVTTWTPPSQEWTERPV